MSMTEDLAVASAKIDADNDQLAVDTAARDVIQAQIDALTPHISLWDEVTASATKYGGEIESEFMAIVAKFREHFNI